MAQYTIHKGVDRQVEFQGLTCAKETSDAGSIRIKKIALFFIGFAVW